MNFSELSALWSLAELNAWDQTMRLQSDRREITALTGLRGVAACYVVAFHSTPETPHNAILRNLLRHGYLAVDIFFVLSGFVMALTYARNFEHGFSRDAYASFLMRRLARVWPVYLVLLGVVAFLSAVGLTALIDVPDRSNLPMLGRPGVLLVNIVMMQGWGLGGTMILPSWSVSTECAAYLLFPLLLKATLSGGRGAAIVSGIASAALLIACALIGSRHEFNSSGPLDLSQTARIYPVLRCLAGFTIGLLVYRLAAVAAIARIASTDGFGFAVLALLLAGLAVSRADLWVYPLFAAIVLNLALNRGWIMRLFSTPVVYFLGVVSYSLYLDHRLLYVAIRPWLDAQGHGLSPMAHHAYVVFAYLGLFASMIGVAFVLNRTIEVPARGWVRNISGWLVARGRMPVH